MKRTLHGRMTEPLIRIKGFNSYFKRMTTLTGIEDTDRLILLGLEGEDLLHACQSDRYTWSLCSSDSFWREKVLREYGLKAVQLKPVKKTFRQQYLDLLRSSDRLYLVDDEPRFLWNEFLNRQDIYYGLVHKFLATMPIEQISGGALMNAALAGETEIIKRYLPLLDLDKETLSDIADKAMMGGHLDLLIWLAQRGAIPSEYSLNRAAENGRLDILKWAYNSLGFLPNKDGADGATLGKTTDVLEWLLQKGVHPTRWGLNYAARTGRVDVLELLLRYGIRPDSSIADTALDSSQIEVLDWLFERGIVPEVIDLHNRDPKVREWLKLHGVHPESVRFY